MEPTHESRSSVEITRNAKGETQWAVKVYRDPGEEEDAKTIAVRLDQALRQLYYPSADGVTN